MIATAVTPEELLAMPDYPVYELVDGELVEKEVSQKAGYVAGMVYAQLHAFAVRTGAGLAFPEVSYQCCSDDPKRVRRPDVSFVLREKISMDELTDGHARVVPDLAVEVVSPNDEGYMIETKIIEYLEAGVRLVWVVYPHTKTVHVRRAEGESSVYYANSVLTGNDVLAGFACPVSEFFATSI